MHAPAPALAEKCTRSQLPNNKNNVLEIPRERHSFAVHQRRGGKKGKTEQVNGIREDGLVIKALRRLWRHEKGKPNDIEPVQRQTQDKQTAKNQRTANQNRHQPCHA